MGKREILRDYEAGKAMTDLLARLAAGPGSRELSDEVLLALGAKRSVIGNFHGPIYAWRVGEKSYTESDYPDPTRSVDDALALVPEGWTVARMVEQDDKSWFVELRKGFLTSYGDVVLTDRNRNLSLPRAICLAILKC